MTGAITLRLRKAVRLRIHSQRPSFVDIGRRSVEASKGFIIRSCACHQTAAIPNQWDFMRDKMEHFGELRIGKRENRRGARIGTAFAMLSASARDGPRSPRERQKNGKRNHQPLPPPRYVFRNLRGRGPGFRLQPALSASRFHRAAVLFPGAKLCAYFGLGIVVLASRLLFPAQRTAVSQPAATAEPAARIEDKTEELALAA